MTSCPVCHNEVQKGQSTCSFCRIDFAKWELTTASKIFSVQTAWSTPPCPKCGKYFTKRVAEEDATDTTSTLRGLLAYRCQLCAKLFRATPPVPREKPNAEQETATRRHYVRVPVEFPARLWTSTSKFPHTGTVKEITIGGCSLETYIHLAQGEELRIELALSEQEPPIMIQKATVSSVRPAGFGLQFTDLQPDEKTRLGRIMEGLLSSAVADYKKTVNQ
jgi:hypothetical protein